jgi:hypothetical protein
MAVDGLGSCELLYGIHSPGGRVRLQPGSSAAWAAFHDLSCVNLVCSRSLGIANRSWPGYRVWPGHC